MTSTQQPPAEEVAVELTGSGTRDAHAVFSVLNEAYASDRDAGDVPQDTPGAGPTVWCATFDASHVRAVPAPVPLTAPVTATLQGGYHAVDSLRTTLASAFDVRMVGSASGDQEQEVHLELASA
jgi:hypothetical protein